MVFIAKQVWFTILRFAETISDVETKFFITFSVQVIATKGREIEWGYVSDKLKLNVRKSSLYVFFDINSCVIKFLQ